MLFDQNSSGEEQMRHYVVNGRLKAAMKVAIAQMEKRVIVSKGIQ